MILKQGHKYEPMPHDGKVIRRIYRGGRCYYHDGPYSLAATQALKAAFPQYWTAISDYGYAHPQLVPFINEDPMLIVSLVEVGKTRWLDNGGSAYIELDYYHNANTKVLAHMKLNSLGSQKFLFGAASNTNYGSCFTIYEHPNGQISWNNGNGGGGWYETSKVYFDLAEHDIEFVAGKYITVSDLIEKSTAGIRPLTEECARKFRVFFDNGDSHHGQPDMKYSKFIINEEEKDIIHLLPFIRNGENGMLDIVSLTFHPNANTEGTFTIEITDKE